MGFLVTVYDGPMTMKILRRVVIRRCPKSFSAMETSVYRFRNELNQRRSQVLSLRGKKRESGNEVGKLKGQQDMLFCLFSC